MKKFRRIVTLITAITLAAMVMSGCEIIDELREEFTETTTEITEGEDAPETPVTNSIALGIVDFDTFNPLLTHSETVKECMEFVYEPLFDVDEKLRPVPVLAESYTVSPDGRTIEIQLRRDITWQDGSPLTSQDAAYTLKQIRAGLTMYTENLLNVADYMGIDDDKLRITLNYAIPNFVTLLNFPIIKYRSDMSGTSAFVPVGTGAFRYAGQPNNDRLLFTAYDGYHGGRANIDAINVYLVPDITKYESMFEASEIDLITGETVDLTEYTPRGSAKNCEYIINDLTYLGFNTRKSELSGADTRKGIAKVIDKEGIVSSAIYSHGAAVDIPINPSSILYYDTSGRIRRDESLAKSYLGNDGWGENAGGEYVRTVRGKEEKLSFEILTEAESAERTAVAQKIAAELTDFGIPASVNELPHEQFINKITAGDYDMMVNEISLEPNGDLTELISSAGNLMGYANVTLDTLVGQMGITQDEEQLKELYRQYGDGILSDMPFAALYFGKSDIISGAKIKTELVPSVTRHFRNVNTWSVR